MTTYNTGNPLGSTEVKDLYDNAQNLDDFSNGQAPAYNDRFGVSRKSLAGIRTDFSSFLISSGYEFIGDYDADGPLLIERPNQIFSKDGEYWRSAPTLALPYTTVNNWATDAPNFVSTGDASLRQALASADPAAGTSLVNHEGVFLDSYLNRGLASGLTPYTFGAVGDGVTDDTVAILAWAASTISRRKYLPSGAYKVTAEVVFNPGDYVFGDGDSSIIDASGGIGGALKCVSVTGSLVALPALASDVSQRTNTLVFSSAPNPALEIGDVVLIWNPTDFSWSTWRSDYRAGEWLRVAMSSGDTVTAFGLTYDGYLAASVQMHKLAGASTTFKDFKIKQPATANAGLHIEFIDSPVVENVTTGGATYAGISIQKCVDIRVNCRARQASTPSGNNYGLAVGNSQGGTIDGVYYGTRHPISLGGATGVGSVSVRNMTIRANYNALDSSIQAADLHGNTEDIKFIGGTFFNGGVVAGKNHKWIGCNFIGRTNDGIALYMGEVVGGTFEFMGCRYETLTNPNPGGNGILTFQNFTANVALACNFIFTGTSISCPNGTTFPILFALNGTAVSVNVAFKGGLTFLRAPDLTQVLRLRQFGATGAFGTVSMLEVSGLPTTGCAYAVEIGAPTISKYALPRQSGAVDIPVTTAASSFTAAVLYPHTYPRAPALVAGNTNPTVGGKRVVSGYQTGATSGFTAIVATTDVANFGSAATAAVTWSSELNEL